MSLEEFQKLLDASPWIAIAKNKHHVCRFFNYRITVTFGPEDSPLIIHHVGVFEFVNGCLSGFFTDRLHSERVLSKIKEFYNV